MREEALETFASTKKRKQISGKKTSRTKRLKDLEALLHKPLFFTRNGRKGEYFLKEAVGTEVVLYFYFT